MVIMIQFAYDIVTLVLASIVYITSGRTITCVIANSPKKITDYINMKARGWGCT